jgi:hypothetical protein
VLNVWQGIEPSFRDLANPDHLDFFKPGFPFIVCNLVSRPPPPLALRSAGKKGKKNNRPPRRPDFKTSLAPAGVSFNCGFRSLSPGLLLLPLKIPH